MKYPYKVFQWKNGEDIYWIAESSLLKGCVAQGNTIDEACEGLMLSEEAWLESANEFGIEIPEIIPEENNQYSGKFTVRIAPYVHKQAVENANACGISLTQYVNDALVSQNAVIHCENNFKNSFTDTIQEFKEMLQYATSSLGYRPVLNKTDNYGNVSSVSTNTIDITYLRKEG